MQGPAFEFGSGAAWLRAALACFALAAVTAASALERIDLYRVVVEDAGASRADIERRAMERLLVRATGSTSAPVAPELAPLVTGASSYVNSFGEPTPNVAEVVFNSTRIERELMRLQWPVWGSERPLTLAWIVVENAFGERAFVGADTAEGVSEDMAALIESVRMELDAVAEDRGLPIDLPLFDLEDLNAVPISEVFGFFEEPVVAASQRYGADAVLLGRVRAGNFPEVSWLLVMDGMRQPFAGYTVREGLDAVANSFAARFAPVGAATPVRLTVLEVENGDDYGRVLSAVRSLSDVRAVAVVSAAGNTLVLEAATRGGAEQLEHLLALDGTLVQDGRGTVQGSAPGIWPAAGDGLVFRVRR